MDLRLPPGCDPARNRFLLAVSGGLDSMVLWHRWQAQFPGTYAVAHLHHGVREEAQQDLKLVQSEAETLGVPLFTERLAPQNDPSEAVLRQQRYAFLHRVQEAEGGGILVTAHHANDQWETLQMRLLRGTGLEGLGGMAHFREGHLRPFLSHSRAELEQYARLHGVRYLHDKTNASARYLRNRLRTELGGPWAGLAEEFGGEAEALRRVQGMTEELQQTAQFLAEQDEVRLAEVAQPTALWWRLNPTAWRRLPPLWQTRVLRRLGRELHGKEVSRAQWQRLAEAVASNTNFDLTPRIRYRYSCGWGFFPLRRELPRLQPTATGVRCVELGMELEGEWKEGQLRFLQPGDRYQGRKMKERLLALGIPALERPWIPVLARPTGNDLLWHFPEPSPNVRISRLKFAFSFLDAPPSQKS